MSNDPLISVRPRSGFALLITITLMAFLVLVLVTLAAITRVETRAAGNSQQLSAARQNALLALNIALGDLQKYAGPDQRTTARAEILDASPTPPGDGAKMWTGVWGNAADPQKGISSNPVLLQWLVSGNHGTDFNLLDDVSYAAADAGRIINSTGTPAITPDLPVTGLSDSVTVSSGLKINGADAALLVGPGTAGSTAGASVRYVVAPLVDIHAKVPGADASTRPRIGGYAYWVGDEGVKARVNLVDPYATPTPQMIAEGNTAEVNSLFRLMAPQRMGVENVTDWGSFPVNDSKARRVLDYAQTGLLDTSLTEEAQAEHFNDLTAASSSVLADALRGGLKRDLTHAFAQSLAGYRAALDLDASSANPIVPTSIMPADEQGPTWEQIYSYGNLDGSTPVVPRRQTETQEGVYPILVQARIGLAGQNVAAGSNSHFILRISPSVVLANPYNSVLASKDYHVRVTFGAASDVSAFIGDEPAAFWRKPIRELFEGQTFVVRCPQLQPGEARVFTLAVDNDPWAAVKTYLMDPDWSDFSIVLDTSTNGGSTFDENVIYDHTDPVTGDSIRAKGVHPVFGDGTPNSTPTWESTYAGPRLSSVSGGSNRGGTLDWALLDTDDTIFQRIEILGYSSNPVSMYGIRGTGIANLGGSFMYLASASNFTANAAFPYFSQYNIRSPLVSRTAYYSSRLNALVSWNLSFQQKFDQWIRLANPGDPSDSRVEWAGAVGSTGPVPLGRSNWQPFDIPRQKNGLISLAQLQHVNLGGSVDGFVYPAAAGPLPSRPSSNPRWRPRYITPAYAIGNSRAHMHIAPDKVEADVSGEPYYDLSYLLNREIFDGYFFSGYPQSGPVDLAFHRLPFSSLQPFRDSIALDDTNAFRGASASADPAETVRFAARNLMLKGGFNINSTSPEAWLALLSSFRGTEFNGETGLDAPYVRSIHQPGGSSDSEKGDSVNAWNGFRNLTQAQLKKLAVELVAQVKSRGPSVSLADFVNRRLATDARAYSGPLQAAIDATTNINGSFPTSIQTKPGTTVTLIAPGDSKNSGAALFTITRSMHQSTALRA